jgi:hypothetical protein
MDVEIQELKARLHDQECIHLREMQLLEEKLDIKCLRIENMEEMIGLIISSGIGVSRMPRIMDEENDPMKLLKQLGRSGSV